MNWDYHCRGAVEDGTRQERGREAASQLGAHCTGESVRPNKGAGALTTFSVEYSKMQSQMLASQLPLLKLVPRPKVIKVAAKTKARLQRDKASAGGPPTSHRETGTYESTSTSKMAILGSVKLLQSSHRHPGHRWLHMAANTIQEMIMATPVMGRQYDSEYT